MTKDLWPEFDVSSKVTPKKIIEQAGDGLAKKTKDLVRFHLGNTTISEGFASFKVELFSPTLKYMYPFLKVRFPMVDGYPVELVADKIPETLHAGNEEELLDMLGRVFQAPSTIDTIQKLIALS
jgi:hypothetical protein